MLLAEFRLKGRKVILHSKGFDEYLGTFLTEGTRTRVHTNRRSVRRTVFRSCRFFLGDVEVVFATPKSLL